MNPEAWIVLGVGIGTVVAQLWAARVSGRVAEKQLEASTIALRNEVASVLVVVRGAVMPDVAKVEIHNGGRSPAIDVDLTFLDENGKTISVGRVPMVQPQTQREVSVRLESVEKRDAFVCCEWIKVMWSDGLGRRLETLPFLAPE
jgi:hypothetical protein